MKVTSLKKNISLLGISLLFYLFLFVFDGISLSMDAQSYITGFYSREPLYPSILFLLRWIFGESSYLYVMVLLQCILFAVATWRLTEVLTSKFSLGIVGCCVIEGIQFAVVLLCRFAAGRKSTYCNSIESEGIAIPLFILFIVELLLFIWNKNYKNLIVYNLFAVCLICTRKQMYIVLPIMFFVWLGTKILLKFDWKRSILMLCSVFVTLGMAVGIDYLYNYALRGEFMRHTKDFAFFTITAFYSSDIDDVENIQNENLKPLLVSIMSEIEEKEYSYKYAPKGLRALADHYGNNYDLIQFEIMYPFIYEYVDKQGNYSANEREKLADDITRQALKELVPYSWFNMLKVASYNIIRGFCNTVSKEHYLLNWYSAFFYLLYMSLIIRNIVKKKNKEITCMALVVAVSVIINVGAVGVTIFTQVRYMIYNMPLIYAAMYLLLWSYFVEKRSKDIKRLNMQE